MTTTVQPDPPPQERDADGLVPALLTVYLVYRVQRAARGHISNDWKTVAFDLGIPGVIGSQLGMIAARALARQRAEAGERAAEALWPFVVEANRSGVLAGIRTVADALIWTDIHQDDVSDTKDQGGIIPTRENPPVELAEMTSQAVANQATYASAQAAGWRYKIWRTVGDADVRLSHRALHGQRVLLAEPFTSGTGHKLQFPGDPDAPIEDRIQCRCGMSTSR